MRFAPFIGYTQAGFTLIELMIVLVVLAVLAVISGPTASSFLHSNRLTTATNGLAGDMNLARSEALKRGTVAGVCKSGGGIACTGAGGWESGWIVFADEDNSGGWSAGDLLIRVYEELPSGTAITASSDAVVYDRRGQTAEGGFVLCNSKIEKSRRIAINVVGRHTITAGDC